MKRFFTFFFIVATLTLFMGVSTVEARDVPRNAVSNLQYRTFESIDCTGNDACAELKALYTQAYTRFSQLQARYNDFINAGKPELANQIYNELQGTVYELDKYDSGTIFTKDLFSDIKGDPAVMNPKLEAARQLNKNIDANYNRAATNLKQTPEAFGQTAANSIAGAAAKKANECGVFGSNSSVLNCFQEAVAWLAYFALTLSAWFVGITGLALNYVLNETVVTMATKVREISAIDVGWSVIRDLCNMTFIYIIIYIAISTILGFTDTDTKRILRNLIIVVLLINFSLFFTKILIDASNILSVEFYDRFSGSSKVAGESAIDSMKNMSDRIAGYLRLPSLFDPSEAGRNQAALFSLGWTKMIITGIGGSILFVVVGLTFLYAALLFGIRFLILIFLLILSPIGYFGYILPYTNSWAKKWWTTLISQLVFAPLYMVLIMLVFLIAEGLKISEKAGLNGVFNNPSATSEIIAPLFFFGLLIGLLNAAAILATTVASGAGGFVGNAYKKVQGVSSNVARRTLKGAGTGSVAAVRAAPQLLNAGISRRLQNTRGAAAQKELDLHGEDYKKLADAGNVTYQKKLAKLQSQAKSDYSLRTTRLGGMLLGKKASAGGYQARYEAHLKKTDEDIDKAGKSESATDRDIVKTRKEIADLQDTFAAETAAGNTAAAKTADDAIKTKKAELDRHIRTAIGEVKTKKRVAAAKMAGSERGDFEGVAKANARREAGKRYVEKARTAKKSNEEKMAEFQDSFDDKPTITHAEALAILDKMSDNQIKDLKPSTLARPEVAEQLTPNALEKIRKDGNMSKADMKKIAAGIDRSNPKIINYLARSSDIADAWTP